MDSILPTEGRHVLHLFLRIEYSQWDLLSAKERLSAKTRLADLVKDVRAEADTQLLTLSMVTPKADLGFMLVCPDLHALDRIGKLLALSLGPGMLTPEFSWLSMTERSEYTTSEDEFAASLVAEEKLAAGTPEFDARLAAFRERMAKYAQDRLEPNLADWPVFCFYPMSKRRAPGQNWYALDFDARKQLMAGHARVGRTYAGRVRQLITGSTGLDDGEWGVTLFAHTTSDIKAIVYEMRFDAVSAHYADFGEFFIGIQMPLDALFARVSL
ncbi:MAG: chlorite dismutase family protein [Terrimicrobiaceae bacterium]|nr:chlorite dismutase family protein [Terrimicrobiaceae bacterium]